MIRHSARQTGSHAHPAKPSRRGSHKRVPAGHTVLGGVLGLVVCLVFLAVVGWYCADVARPDATQTSSFWSRFVHSLQTVHHRQECSEFVEKAWQAVFGSEDHLKHFKMPKR